MCCSDQQGMTSSRNFLRVRYEDVAQDPLTAAQEIYKYDCS